MKKLSIIILALAGFAAHTVTAATFNVPGNYGSIQAAINAVPSGSVIEVSPGTYTEYLTALDLNKSLYIRAIGGSDNTIISGAGSQKLLYIANSVNGNSEINLVFDGFTFANGREFGNAVSPITIADAKPLFKNCVFRNNRAALKGGALLVFGSLAHPKFLNCTFRDNLSEQTGGAALINGGHAQATFKECLFENNSNRWADGSAGDNGGGAIYFSVAGGRVIDCVFRSNSCSYAGGAITSLTLFDQTEDYIYVEGTVFDSNFADPLPGQSAPGNTEAGAFFSEGNVRVDFYRCYFTNNYSEGGGAIQSYRAHFSVRDCVFVNNHATGGLGTGGAISMSNDDVNDIDNREGTLNIENTLIRDCTGHAGGGIYYIGDQFYGKKGPVTLRNVVIENCRSIQTKPYDGHGAGMYVGLGAVTAQEVYFINNRADQGGGGITMVLDTDWNGSGCYLIGNQASGGNHAVYDPQNNNPSWSSTYFGHNPPGSGGSSLTMMDQILDYTLFGQDHLVYGIVPNGGSRNIQPGSISLPNDGGYRAGTVSTAGGSDDIKYTLSSSSETGFVKHAVMNPQASYFSTVPSVPGWLDAENYDRGGNGRGYWDSSVGNAGTAYRTGENVEIAADASASNNQFVGWIQGGEWLEYTFRADVFGTYDLRMRLASPNAQGKFYVYLDGTRVRDVMNVPSTGGWSTWQSVFVTSFTLGEGLHKLRIHAAEDGFNFDGMSLQLQTLNPFLAVTPLSLNFATKVGNSPPGKSFTVQNAGSSTLTYQIQTNVGWLTVSPSSGSSSGELDTMNVQVSASGLSNGTYNGTITVLSNGENGNESINVSLVVREDTLGPLDYDGDGRADLAVYRPSNNRFYIRRSSDSTVVSYEWGLLSTDIPVPGDYDGDGTADRAVYQANGTWHLARSSAGYAGLQLGQPNDIPVQADYDGDGATDMAIFEPYSGVWHQSKTAEGYAGFIWGSPGNLPVPADYDGDGNSEPAVFDPQTQNWSIRLSPTQQRVFRWGLLPTDRPIPADYDGDGIDDAAVYQSNGTWHLARSSAGYAGLQLGGPGDIPVPADYDGDGAIDMAIFETKGTWHLSQTTEGYRGIVFGQPGDIPVRTVPRY